MCTNALMGVYYICKGAKKIPKNMMDIRRTSKMTNPLEMTASEFITRDGGDILETYSDNFKNVNGFRPRGPLYSVEKATDFYNAMYEVARAPDFLESEFWLTPKAHILEDWEREEEEERQWAAQYEHDQRWESAELSGDFSEVRGDFEAELTTNQTELGTVMDAFAQFEAEALRIKSL